MYADGKQWPLEAVHIVLSYENVPAGDRAASDTKIEIVGGVEMGISFTGSLSDRQGVRPEPRPLRRPRCSIVERRGGIAAGSAIEPPAFRRLHFREYSNPLVVQVRPPLSHACAVLLPVRHQKSTPPSNRACTDLAASFQRDELPEGAVKNSDCAFQESCGRHWVSQYVESVVPR